MKRIALIGLILTLTAVALLSTLEALRVRDELAAANARADLARAQAKDLGGILRKTQSGAVLKTQRAQERFERRLSRSQPCPSDQDPVVWAIPRAARVGERVEMVGDCFVSEIWRNVGADGRVPVITSAIGRDGVAGARNVGRPGNPETCELRAGATDGWFRIDDSGRMRGWFIVPAEGICSYQDGRRHALVPGRYSIEFSYHLRAGRFTVVDG